MKLPTEMVDEGKTRSKSKWRFLLKATGFALGVFLIVWFVSQSDLSAIWALLQRIHFRFIFLIAVTFTAYLTVTIAWKLSFLQPEEGVSVARLFLIRLIGESLAQINPTNVIAGETLKAVLLRRRGVSYKNGIVSLTMSRFIISLSAITLILSGIYIFFDSLKFQGNVFPLVVAVSLVFILFIVMIYFLRSGKGIFYLPIAFINFLRKRNPDKERLSAVIHKLEEIDGELIEFYKTKKLHFIVAFLLSLTHWLIGAMEFYLILYFLGYNVSFISCIAIEVGVMVFKALGAFVPGQIGIEEYATKLMLEMVNVEGGAVWITVSILRRARQLFWIAAGFIAFFFTIRKTKELNDGSAVYNS